MSTIPESPGAAGAAGAEGGIDHFYRSDGDEYLPSGIGVSPWNGTTQNGIALAGLVAHLLERAPGPPGMHPARLQIDILGAVPMAGLRPALRTVRDGRRLQMLELELARDGRIWVRATLLRVRTAETPDATAPPTAAFPDAAAGPPVMNARFSEGYRLRGALRSPGPGVRWLRMLRTVVEGEPLTAFERVVMAADYGTGTAPLLAHDEWTMANVDISIHLTRLPRGEWLLLDASSESAGNGIGLVNMRLGDRDGMIGTSHQTIFVERRGGADARDAVADRHGESGLPGRSNSV